MSKTDSGRKLKTAAALYMTVLALAASAAFGWFIFNKEASIVSATGEDTVQIEANGGDLEIFLVSESTTDEDIANDANWASERTFSPDNQKYYIDISGDGSRLWYPRKLDAGNRPNLTDGSVENITDKDGYYVTLKLLFRTTTAMDVYLGSDSCVIPLEKIAGESTYARRSINSPETAPFSCDGIVGAARVAFLEEVTENGTKTKVLKNLWIPNDLVQLQTPDAGNPNYRLSASGSSERATSGYSFLTAAGDNLTEHQITSDEYASGLVTVTSGWKNAGTEDKPFYVNSSSGVLASAADSYSYEAPRLLSFTGNGVMQYKTLYVRLWFEGTDREADSAFSGGLAGYRFSFVGLCKAAPEDVNISYDSETAGLITDSDDDGIKIEYSVNGSSWSTYAAPAEGLHPEVHPGAVIYVRTGETASTRRGNVTKLVIPE